MAERKGLERRLFWLYEGFGTGPYLFRWILLAIDAFTVAFFLWAPLQEKTVPFYIADAAIGVFILQPFGITIFTFSRQNYEINWWQYLTNNFIEILSA